MHQVRLELQVLQVPLVLLVLQELQALLGPQVLLERRAQQVRVLQVLQVQRLQVRQE